MESFYLTLLSNSSSKIFPNNRTSRFNVHLNKELNLEGDWCVALTELSYPFTFYNVTEKHNRILIEYDMYTIDGTDKTHQVERFVEDIFIAPCYCSSISQLISVINETFHDNFNVDLFEKGLNKANQVCVVQGLSRKIIDIHKVQVAEGMLHAADKLVYKQKPEFFTEYLNTKEISYENFKISLEGRLAIQMGFQPGENIASCLHSPQAASHVFGVPDQLFVYSDIIMPQEISDSCSQVLKIVKTADHNSIYGDVISREIFNLNYIPLCKKKFQTIEVELRDSTGQLAAFQFGTSIAQLHFKKAPNQK